MKHKIIAIDRRVNFITNNFNIYINLLYKELEINNLMESCSECHSKIKIIVESNLSTEENITKLMNIITEDVPRQYKYMDDNYRATYHVKVIAFKKLEILMFNLKDQSIIKRKTLNDFYELVNKEIGKRGPVCFSQAYHEFLLVIKFLRNPSDEFRKAFLQHSELVMNMWKHRFNHMDLDSHIKGYY